ncbi:MAG: ATP-dependent DNA helicase [bacterium]
MNTAVFDSQYKNLNAAQKHAVDAIEGPVMVVAGPGTGKTQILTLRIANILLKTQVNPSNILALTFTTAATANMRERLIKVIGNAAYMTNIFTFHSFCQHIITEHPDDFWEILGRKLADDIQKVEAMEAVLDGGTWEHIRPYSKPYFYVPEALRAISDLKREGVTPDELGKLVAEDKVAFDAIPDKESTRAKGKLKGIYQDELKRIEKNAELSVLYAAYQKKLHAADLYDYDDLIMYSLDKLQKDEDFRLRVMEQYQYILVDEHQDSNNAQNKIVRLLGSFDTNPNIFVVGDEKQAIFRFQGASVENFRSFKEIYPEAQLITLSENYRSTQTILDGALELLKMEESQALASRAPHPDGPITILTTPDLATQLATMAESIKKILADGIPAHEVAVLVRTRAQGKQIASYLESHGLPAHRDASENIFEDPAVAKLITILTAVHQYGSEEPIFPVLLIDIFGLDPLDVYKLSQAASRGRKNIYDLLSTDALLEKVGVKESKKIIDLGKKIGQWSVAAHNIPLHQLLHQVVQESGLLTSILQSDDSLASIAALRTLYDTMSSLDHAGDWKLANFFTYLSKVREHGIKVQAAVSLSSKGKVQVMTVHASKGLEFDHVYIPFAQENVWGGRGRAKLFKLPDGVYMESTPVMSGGMTGRGDAKILRSAQDDGDSNDDDAKRLFFVALTRARKSVTLSYATSDAKGDPLLPTPFIAEIRTELKQERVVEMPSADAVRLEILRQAQDDKKGNQDNSKLLDFIHASLEHYGISVSALNNYLDCPWKYFYVNLVRIPAGKNKTLMFGNAIHNALSYFFKHFKDTGDKSRDYLLTAFEKCCDAEQFTREEHTEALPRGKDFLRAYYDHYEDTFTRNINVKYRITGVQLDSDPTDVIPPARQIGGSNAVILNGVKDLISESAPIKLTGELDMMTYLDDTFTQVRVTDFKTGKAKSRNEIEGKTKNADGNYYRQLVFYKLLLKYQAPKLRMIEGELDFIQHDADGSWHREAFVIPEEEVVELESVVQKTVGEIRTLAFWERTCDDPACEWCALRASTHPKEFEEGLF